MRSVVLAAVAALSFASVVRSAPLPQLPAAAELLEATPFAVEEPVVLPSGEAFAGGHVLVIRADAALTQPRQEAMPVLQCGERLAFAASRGDQGILVAVVLGDADLGDVDLGEATLFFGAPELPGRVTREDALRRLADARDAGLVPVGAEAAARALARGSAPIRIARFEDLSPFLLALRCRIEPEALAEAGTPCGIGR